MTPIEITTKVGISLRDLIELVRAQGQEPSAVRIAEVTVDQDLKDNLADNSTLIGIQFSLQIPSFVLREALRKAGVAV